jgi:hypothetical protein
MRSFYRGSGSFLWRIVLLPKVGFDSQLIHTVDEDAEVVTENLAKCLVDLRGLRPATEVRLKLALDHRVNVLSTLLRLW